MNHSIKKTTVIALAFASLASCSPKEEFDKFVLDQGYIPFQQPLADLGVGSLISGSPSQLRITAPPKRCFPDASGGVPTDLRVVTTADIGQIDKKMSLDASGDANVIAANGTPLFKVNTKFSALKSLDIKIEGASIEFLDEISFANFVDTKMDAACKKYLKQGGTFVRQALRVDKMSFQFKDQVNGNIDLSLGKIKEIVDIDVHVKWELTDNYTLTITTPKYIGYHLARTSKTDPASLAAIASSLKKDGSFDFKPVNPYRFASPHWLF